MKPWLALSVLLGVQWSAYAAECSAVFTDGASTHDSNGSITFKLNSQIIDSDGSIDFDSIDDDSNGSSCFPVACSISGNSASALDLESFRNSSSSMDFQVNMNNTGSLAEGEYDSINVEQNGVLNFTTEGGTYIIDSLDLKLNTRGNFAPGDYWIKDLTLEQGSAITLTGTGTVRIFVDDVDIKLNANINNPGDSAQLSLIAYDDVVLEQGASVNGVVYALDEVTLNLNARITGAVSAKDVTLEQGSAITYDSSAPTEATLGDVCEADIPEQLYAFYQFGEDSWSGTNSVLDTSGNARHASPVGNAEPDFTSTCGVLDIGSNTAEATQYAIDTGFDLNDVGDKGTISFWYRSNLDWSSSTGRQLIDASNEAPAQDKHFYLALDNGVLEFGIEDEGDNGIFAELTGLSYGAEQWVHVAVTWDIDSNRIQIYTNTSGSSRTASRTQSNFNVGLGDMDTLYIGDNRSGYRIQNTLSTVNSADGQFDDFRIYNYVRSSGELSSESASEPDCSVFHHIEISHDGNALTCEAETVRFRACADTSCNTLYDENIDITLSPVAGWTNSDGTAVTSTRIPANSSISLGVSSTDPGDVSLGVSGLAFECTGNTGNSCTLSFADTGFQFIGASLGDTIPMQIAEQAFSSAQLRAVKTDDTSGSNQCVALLSGDQTVNFGLNCTSPSSCVKSLDANGTSVSEVGNSEVTLNFDADGFADLSVLTYPDAGEITLSAEAEIEGASIISASTEVDVRPVSLKIETTTSTSNQRAGLPFETTIGAYGAIGDEPLPNYRMGDIQFSLQRTAPTSANTVDGTLTGPGSLSISSAVTSTFSTTGLSDSDPEVSLLNGINTFDLQYSEVATLSLSVRDANYLGYTSGISGQASLPLGEFIPAYFDVEHVENKPAAFCQTPTASFSYLGQPLNFEDDWVFTISALNADGVVTQNYQGDKWDWLFDSGTGEVESAIQGTLTETAYAHNPQPGETLTMTNIAGGEASREEVTSGGVVEHGKQRVTISGMQFSYDKPDDLIREVDVDFNLSLASALFTDETHLDDMGQPSTGNYICYFETYDKDALANCDADSDNNKKIISNLIPDEAGDPLSASTVRWGRIVLENVFGPENENLLMQVKTEYVVDTDPTARERLGFAPNRDDQCTNFVWSDGNFSKTDKSDENGYSDITGVVSISADFTVLDGITQGLEGISITAPSNGERGELEIKLVPDGEWDSYLQFDWDGDPANGIQPPFATATFGQFRGNDRIIHWREIY